LGKKLYVGNLPFTANEADLRTLFEAHGAVASVNVINDRDTGRPRGFGFVEMQDEGSAGKAIKALDGRDFQGRNLKVNEANDRGPGGGGGGGSRGSRY
jgi:RNA recognition motif-containing protein